MMRQLYFLLFLLFLTTSSYAQADSAFAQKEQGVKDAVVDLYKAYSFEDGNFPAIENILVHFTDDATLSYIRQDSLVTLPVAEFFERWQKNNRENEVEYLQEVEKRGRTEVFNSIAHRISSVEFTLRGKQDSFGRAIISLQLAHINGKWFVHTMLWESVGEETSLPDRFREQE